jgi:archaellum component FlaF (FlaF/FlaG flagellin family)
VGFASIGAFIILFFSLVIVISTFALINGRMVESTSLAYQVERERLEQATQTSIAVESAVFDNSTSPDTTTLILNNTGQNKLELGYIDVYIDGIRLPRDPANRTIAFVEGYTLNPLHWDPGESIVITAFLDLQEGQHTARVTTDYSVQDMAVFDNG